MPKNNKSPQQTTHKQSKPASQVYSIDQKVHINPLKINGIVKGYDPHKNLYLITYFNHKNKRMTKWFDFDQISNDIKVRPINKNEQVIPLMTEEGRKIIGNFIKKEKENNSMEQKSVNDYLGEIKEIIPSNIGILTTPSAVYSQKYVDDLKEQIEHYKTLYLEYKNLYETQKNKMPDWLNSQTIFNENKKETK